MLHRQEKSLTCKARLRVMGTTDVHLHLVGYDYYVDQIVATAGLAGLATLIAQARLECPNHVLLDNGDFLQGNPMGDYAAQELQLSHETVHPAILAMNYLKYDAGTLGNHEFNYGLDVLTRALKDAEFPFVSANLSTILAHDLLDDQTFVPPFAILDRVIAADDGHSYPIKIGVIGFTPPQIVRWDRQWLEGKIFTRCIAQTAQKWVPVMRALGADLVIALSHSGIGEVETGIWAENATAALAHVPGIDAIIAGHSHLLFPSQTFAQTGGVNLARGTLFDVPTVMPGFYGSHLGIIDLDLSRDQGRWHKTAATVDLRAADRFVPPEPGFLRMIAPEHEKTMHYARQKVGVTKVPLHSFFATLIPSIALRVVGEALINHAKHHLKGQPEEHLPMIAAASPFRSGARGGPHNYIDVPVGDLALRHLSDLYMFPNMASAFRIRGDALCEWLENSVGLYNHIPPFSTDHFLIDDAFPSYNHDRFMGLTFDLDLGQPRRYDRHGILMNPGSKRVSNVLYMGRPIAFDEEFLMITSGYRAAGSGGYRPARPDQSVDIGRVLIRDLLHRHIASSPPVQRSANVSFKFRPMPGTSVLFDTSPRALAYLDQIAVFSPEFLGMTDAGFARLRLCLDGL